MSDSSSQAQAQVTVTRSGADLLIIGVGGDWRRRHGLPGVEVVERAVAEGPAPKAVDFDVSELQQWDSGLLAFLVRCLDLCRQRSLECRLEHLPAGVQRLIALAEAVPEKKDAKRRPGGASWVGRWGQNAIDRWRGGWEVLTFVGENVLALGKLLRGKAQFRWSDTFVVMQEAGPEALSIVALINFLVGLILAFVGAVQLTQFGASIYVADLVAIGTVREMGCIMTGIIICGRTGAAFAAQLGTMKVNQEIDALRTFGIAPVEFLVLPRMIALILMMPLLCVFADLIGILGGFAVSISMLDVTAIEYLDRTLAAIQLKSFLLGVFKGGFFGVLVALSGCLRGMQCGNNAAAVGQATTASVVTGITAIIAADGIFAVLCNALHI